MGQISYSTVYMHEILKDKEKNKIFSKMKGIKLYIQSIILKILKKSSNFVFLSVSFIIIQSVPMKNSAVVLIGIKLNFSISLKTVITVTQWCLPSH